MAIDVNWKFQAAVQGGPNLAADQPAIKVDAYDVVQVNILAPVSPATAVKSTVFIQPVETGPEVIFFALTSSKYDGKLTYTVNPPAASRPLDGPLLLIGSGAVGLLDANPPKKLEINNGTGSAVDIQILVGRKNP
jgi:hypothetical protein